VLSIDDIPETHRDLIRSPLIAVFTTVDTQDRPQSTAVCYRAVDGTVVLAVAESRQKFINLQTNANCSLIVVDPQNPLRTLELRATAELESDSDMSGLNALAAVYGADPEPWRATGGDRWTVRLRIRRIIASPPP
jgi:PPOX class probable F420-dependent enzyme